MINQNAISDWISAKLQLIGDHNHILVRDPLHLLPGADGVIHTFARKNSFTVIVASTNLVFRELYELAMADADTKKFLVVDRAPARRRASLSVTKAPPPFYPDFLGKIEPEARIDLDLRQYLIEITGDLNWPQEVNSHRYAQLVMRNLGGVIRAHENLRNAHSTRFTDHDFKMVVAYAALGVPDSAFKMMDAEDYWRIGLLGHRALEELESLAPEITKPIRDALAKAPAPFCWFADHDPDLVLRAFYLSVILSQHSDHWNLLIPKLDPTLAQLPEIKPQVLNEAAPKLIQLDPQQASEDIEQVENSLDKEALQFILIEQLDLVTSPNFRIVIEKERYSTLFRSLALLVGLDDMLSKQPSTEVHDNLEGLLFAGSSHFVEKRPSEAWSQLKEAYSLAVKVRLLCDELASAIKTLKVLKPDQLTLEWFWKVWNIKKLNRLEYFISALERHVLSADLLPRHEDELPSVFSNILDRIQQRVRSLSDDIDKQLDELNGIFQELVARKYPEWVAGDSEVLLTSQFLRRCLNPNWDPDKEKAVLFIFDGMRYEIWDELLRPVFEERMELVADYPALSILPSETHFTRKAISAGAFPDEFDSRSSEDKLLKEGLTREFGLAGDVEQVAPDTIGTGEVVRYRAGDLDVYIFELCDSELHNIQMRSRPDGRQAPARPLAFIYEQLLKNVIDIEVMAIVRKLEPDTKVFVTADHGFMKVGREALWFREEDLNESGDCHYLNCWLRSDLDSAYLPSKVRSNIIGFTPEQLHLPKEESRSIRKTGEVFHKDYGAIVFPRVGYSFSRSGSHYNPDAYTHGGISIQELLIPMVALRVRPRDEGILLLGDIEGPKDVVEGQEIEFRLHLSRIKRKDKTPGDLRVDASASYALEPEHRQLHNQVLYIPPAGDGDVVYSFKPDCDDATDEERREGIMKRILTITVSYRDGRQTIRRSRTHQFAVQLNPGRIARRIPANLGNILGLTPKSMR